MYEKHFGFHRKPFQSDSPAAAFVVSESIAALKPRLLRCVRSGLGMALVSGLAGSGKTALLRHLQRELATDGRAVFVSGTSLENQHALRQALMLAACRQAGEADQAAASPADLTTWSVIGQLRQSFDFWGPVILLIDDLQMVGVPTLNELRALCEESFEGRPLLRVIGSSPASFELECSRPEYEYFRHGVRCSEFLQPFSSEESLCFLKQHLRCCGGDAAEVFTQPALELMLQACGGNAAALAVLADESLAAAAEFQQLKVDCDTIRRALTQLRHLAFQWNTGVLEDAWSEQAEELDDSLHQHNGSEKASETDSVVEIVGMSPVSETAKPETDEPALKSDRKAPEEQKARPTEELTDAGSVERTTTGYAVEVGFANETQDVTEPVEKVAGVQSGTPDETEQSAPDSDDESFSSVNPPEAAAKGTKAEAVRSHSTGNRHPQPSRGRPSGFSNARSVIASDEAIEEMLRSGSGNSSNGWFAVRTMSADGTALHSAGADAGPPRAARTETLRVVTDTGDQTDLKRRPTPSAAEGSDQFPAREGVAGPDARMSSLFTRLRKLQELSRQT